MSCSCCSSSVAKPCPAVAHQLLRPWDFPGKTSGLGCHVLLQGASWPRAQTHVSCLAGGGFLTLSHLGSPVYAVHLTWILYMLFLTILTHGGLFPHNFCDFFPLCVHFLLNLSVRIFWNLVLKCIPPQWSCICFHIRECCHPRTLLCFLMLLFCFQNFAFLNSFLNFYSGV